MITSPHSTARDSAAFISAQLRFDNSPPSLAVVLGSGLSAMVDGLSDVRSIAYRDIPGFPLSTTAGHVGELFCGLIAGRHVVMLSGRSHIYEGGDGSGIAFVIRTLGALGIERMLLTNAAGGIRGDLAPGSLMLISDQVNFTFRNVLIGPHVAGENRFPDMSSTFDPDLCGILREGAREKGIPLAEGTCAGVAGPSYETAAEVRMLARLGADAVGMSTVQETIAARALGIRCAAISCITNRAAGFADQLSHEDVLRNSAAAGDRMRGLIEVVCSPVNRDT